MSDFAYVSTFPLVEEVTKKTLKSQFESGHTQVRSKWSTPLRSWTLAYSNIDKATYTAILAFFVLKGAVTSFTWTNPNDSTEYTVRFSAGTFKSAMIGFETYDFEFKLDQVK